MRWSRFSLALLLSGALCFGADAFAQTNTFSRDAKDDLATADRNAVISLGYCTGTLITDMIVLTAAHCVRSELRAVRPDSDKTQHCRNLPHQHELQNQAWEDPMTWQIFPRGKVITVYIGGERNRPNLSVMVRAYSLPRCADMALLQLVRRVPPALATPVRVLTSPLTDADDPDAYLRDAKLGYAGWGLGDQLPDQLNRRQIGRVSYWDRNACMLYTLPPERDSGDRIVQGDSGSPLLMRIGKEQVVAGVLFGSGLPDPEICGRPLLRPPARHGAYTPTFRRVLAGTDATDLAAWIAHFAPGAVWQPPSDPDLD